MKSTTMLTGLLVAPTGVDDGGRSVPTSR